MTNERIEGAYIDEEFADRVEHIVDSNILKDETWKFWKKPDKRLLERMNYSELKRLFGGFTQYDFAAAVLIAMENYPFMVMQIVAEYVERKGEK